VLDDRAWLNVSGFRTFDDLCAPPLPRKVKRIKEHTEEIAALAPDLVVVVGFSQIIPKTLLEIPPLGVGRWGCSPIIWAIVDGHEETGVTMFYMDGGIDTGDVIAARELRIEANDTAAEVLRVVQLLHVTANMSLMEQSALPRHLFLCFLGPRSLSG
jgi:methionyl-tRNA formyltransferase